MTWADQMFCIEWWHASPVSELLVTTIDLTPWSRVLITKLRVTQL